MLMRLNMKLCLLFAALFLTGKVFGGDCHPGKNAQHPEMISLHQLASKGCSQCSSKLYGTNLQLCSSETESEFVTKSQDDFVYAVSAGDSKCGKTDPYFSTEFISTTKLHRAYQKYAKDFRIWVLGKNGKSKILTAPKTIQVNATQSIRDCIKSGPQGFTCVKGMKRIQCCRDYLSPLQSVTFTYDHPFLPNQLITYSTLRQAPPMLSVGETEVVCNGPNLIF
jgi:hypothetical protein